MYTPDKNILEQLFISAFRASLKAGVKIMEIYDSDEDRITMKSDNSPISLADKLAHDCISEELSTSRIPILSEEGRDLIFDERKAWDVLWIVDPLDATRQFIKKGKEFTVNIALVINNYPVFGIIYAPALHELYFGFSNKESRKMIIQDPQTLLALNYDDVITHTQLMPSVIHNREQYVVLTSTNHTTNETLDYIDELKTKYADVQLKQVSSSLKICQIADGMADLYVRHSPTYEWDTAAAQAIIEGVKGSIRALDSNKRLIYNQESLYNPNFVCTLK